MPTQRLLLRSSSVPALSAESIDGCPLQLATTAVIVILLTRRRLCWLLQDAVDAANQRKDNAGNSYVIELRRIEEVLPPL
jgi:hypothetical protein